jgi:hypothetical protein
MIIIMELKCDSAMYEHNFMMFITFESKHGFRGMA